MLFRSKTAAKTWDAWIYWEDGTYFLYYLISDEYVCDGFGIATSQDGIHWQDHGWALRHSEKMVRYFAFGSLWRNLGAWDQPKYICSYSEWQVEDGRNVQVLYFAASDDLLTWERLGDDKAFRIDERFYKRVEPNAIGPWQDPRWDGMCVIPRTEGGYYGYWTATPKDFLGFGFGVSADGAIGKPWNLRRLSGVENLRCTLLRSEVCTKLTASYTPCWLITHLSIAACSALWLTSLPAHSTFT